MFTFKGQSPLVAVVIMMGAKSGDVVIESVGRLGGCVNKTSDFYTDLSLNLNKSSLCLNLPQKKSRS